ncbi:Ribokinase [Hypsibius exemplaris]|uniref:Ribokinase n=1 Tax=Hypsibius exemplaris TaxID=2072580 RepID=A0A1W0WIE6_HYPEX|nr:Ribokinase [Hypsibius exemplaris]
MVDVVVVGSLMIDLVSVVDRIPKLGETIHGRSFQQNFGGKGANQCVAAGRLGASVALIGNVGDDQYGTQYLAELKNNSINTEFVQQVSGCNTGIASIWVDGKGQNSIIITANANERLTIEDVTRAESLIKTAKIVICQLEVPQEVTLAALKMAKKHNVRSIFNPAPAVKDLSTTFLQYTDIFCPNETEAELLCGFPVDSDESCQRALTFFLEQGARVPVITLGERGAAFATKEHPDMQTVKTDAVVPVDSTGAGDAFVGALACLLATKPDTDFAEAVSRACKYASLTVQSAGTQPSYPTRQQLHMSFFH